VVLPPVDPKCPRCGAHTGTSRFCPSCGAPLEAFVRGQILDEKYEILGKIAAGGMGEVYRARHIHLDEIRIIKVTRPEESGGTPEPRRFQEEARLAALVRHPNVAALHDFSRRPDGTFYMVWEYIDGVTLQHRLKQGPLPLNKTIEISLQVLAGLEAIHDQGIVHRDLSPDNIMISETSSGRLQAKIIDLGIAKRLTAESLQMTGTGIFLGKVKYGSPEQAGSLRSGQTIDERSDIYSFGVVLYEMLMGKAPFEAETPREYLGKHLHQAPPPLDPGRLPAAAGPAVAAVVAKALEKDRERRFQTVRELADALRALSTAAPPDRSGPNDKTVATGAKTASSSRKALLPALTTVVVLAAVASVWLASHRKTPPGPTAASPAPAIATPMAVEPSASPSPLQSATTPSVAVPAVVAVETATVRPTAAHSPIHRPTRTSTPSPTVPPTITSTPLPTAALFTTPRPRLEKWRSRPIEERARTAQQLAQWANQVVSQRPDAPDMASFRKDVAALFKSETLGALDRNRPGMAALFYRAYLSLDFAPADPDLALRMKPLLMRKPTPR
jgi:serine/threonine-protein kinase